MSGAIRLLNLYVFNTWRGIICMYCVYIYIYIYESQNNVAGIVIKLRDGQKKKGGLTVGRSRSFSFPKGPYRLGSHSSLQLNGYWGLFY
jgi:hypothetical protein